MGSNNINELKHHLIQLTLETDNIELLEKVIAHFQNLLEQEDWADTLSETERKFLEQSAKQIDQGKVYSSDLVQEEVKEILRKAQ